MSTTMMPSVFHQPVLLTIALLVRAASPNVIPRSAINGRTYSHVTLSHTRKTRSAIQPMIGSSATMPQTTPIPTITSQKIMNLLNLRKPPNRSAKLTPRLSRAAPITISKMPP